MMRMRMVLIRIMYACRIALGSLMAACLAVSAGHAEMPSGAVELAADAATGEAQVSTVLIQATSTAGPAISATGANQYGMTGDDISAAPKGRTAPLSDVLAQMPGVSLDQNQQIHIRSTEGPQFQYQINGVLVPLDINTNPPFLSMINPMFVGRLDLLTGILPSRYSYATGGVVEIDTKQGCDAAARDVTLFSGQRETVQPS